MENEQSKIKKIYTQYFNIVDDFFGSIKHYLKDNEESHIDLGSKMASYPLISDLIIDSIDDLDKEIEKFWSEHAKTVYDFVKKQNTLKCVYSGDISPVILENFIKKTALYVDTVIIPDPIYNLTLFQKQIILDKKQYLNKLIRHVFNIWKLKDLILADVNTNILFVLPINLSLIQNKDRNSLLTTANKKFTKYINNIYGENLSESEESLQFLESFRDDKSLFGAIKDTTILPNTFKDQAQFSTFLADFSKTSKYTKFENQTPGWNLGLYIQSQFIRVQEHKFFCKKLIAEPIYDYELPWFFFNYEIGGLDMDAAVTNALQKEQFEWINKVPLTALKTLREENKLEYMRSILRKGITDLKAKKDSDLSIVASQIEKNLNEAFKQQKTEIKSLEKEVENIMKKELPIVSGGFLAGFIPVLNNVVSILTAGRDIYGIFKEREKIKQQIVAEENEFINLLIQAHDKTE